MKTEGAGTTNKGYMRGIQSLEVRHVCGVLDEAGQLGGMTVVLDIFYTVFLLERLVLVESTPRPPSPVWVLEKFDFCGF